MTRRARTENDRGGRGLRALRDRIAGLVPADPVAGYLITSGALHAGIGATWIMVPSKARSLGVDWIPGVSPALVGVVWLLVGAYLVGGAMGAPTRIALVIAQAWPVVVGAYYLVAWITWEAAEALGAAPIGSPSGYVSVLLYWSIGAGAHFVAELWADRTEHRLEHLAADGEGAPDADPPR